MINNEKRICDIKFEDIVTSGDLTGEQCKQLRQSTGMTIDEFAKEIGLNRKTIMKAEKGEISDRTFEYYFNFFNGSETTEGDVFIMTEKHLDLWDQTEDYLTKAWDENAALRKEVLELKIALKEALYQQAKYQNLAKSRIDEVNELRDRNLELIQECAYWKENSEIKDIKNPTEEDFPSSFHTEWKWDKDKEAMVEIGHKQSKGGKTEEVW